MELGEWLMIFHAHHVDEISDLKLGLCEVRGLIRPPEDTNQKTLFTPRFS